MTTEAKKWPIDFEALRKGDVIGTELLQQIFGGLSPSHANWAMQVLQLRGTIERFRPDLTTKAAGPTIKVLHDHEVAPNSVRRIAASVRGIKRAKDDLIKPRTENMSDAEKRYHESTLFVAAGFEQALKSAARKLGFNELKKQLAETNEE